MGQPTLTHASRCLVILAGGVLERCIETRARTIAAGRSARDITPEHIEEATAEFFREELSNLPCFVQRAMNEYPCHSCKAA
jgi:hypothetical protein